jgi:hypothetical protein
MDSSSTESAVPDYLWRRGSRSFLVLLLKSLIAKWPNCAHLTLASASDSRICQVNLFDELQPRTFRINRGKTDCREIPFTGFFASISFPFNSRFSKARKPLTPPRY